jgi:hypothetical protein
MPHPLFFPVLLSFIVSWMHVWLWLYSLGPYSPTNPTGILAMTFWFIFIWTWFELANLDNYLPELAPGLCNLGTLIYGLVGGALMSYSFTTQGHYSLVDSICPGRDTEGLTMVNMLMVLNCSERLKSYPWKVKNFPTEDPKICECYDFVSGSTGICKFHPNNPSIVLLYLSRHRSCGTTSVGQREEGP